MLETQLPTFVLRSYFLRFLQIHLKNVKIRVKLLFIEVKLLFIEDLKLDVF